MHIRTLLFSTLILFCSGTAMAQRPGPEFWRKVGCEPFEPRTKLESFEGRQGSVIIKGFTRVRTVEIGGIRIDAVEIRDLGDTPRPRGIIVAKGVVIALREGGDRPNENRAYVDYEEIDPLLTAIDTISRVDETATKLVGFEARYRTLGDLEFAVFRQTRSGAAVTVTTGICDHATVTISLDDLARVKAMIQEAKSRLDELK